jgi:phosphopantothenoylcysteine decarboxylase/phosphopantothenate--cysteine ligase
MVENQDIAAALGQRKHSGQILVTFAAETEKVLDHAANKLKKKNGDLMVANDVTRPGAGFDVDTNIVTFIEPDGSLTELPCLPKSEVADKILDKVSEIMNR